MCVSARNLIAILFFSSISTPLISATKSEIELGKTYLKYGFTNTKIIYELHGLYQSQTSSPDHYHNVASRYKTKIKEGQLAAGAISNAGNLIAGGLAYAAAIDPEPMSKLVITGLAAGIREGIDYASETVIQASEKNALGILRETLDSDAQKLDSLLQLAKQNDPVVFQNTLNNLTSGVTTLREKLGNSENAMQLIGVHAWNALAVKQNAQLVMQAQQGRQLDTMLSEFRHQSEETVAFFNEVNDTLGRHESLLTKTREDIKKLDNRVQDLQKTVGENTQAQRVLGQIQFMEWSPQQQIAALNSGLFPDLKADIREQKVEELQAQIDLQKTVRGLTGFASDLGKLNGIANNLDLDLPKDVVKGIGLAQTATTAAAQYLSGDVIGAALSVSSMFGKRKSNPNAAMMKYLQAAFKQINAKLDNIEKLQKATLTAIQNLHEDVIKMHEAEMASLAKIQFSIDLANDQLEYLVFKDYRPCSLVAGSNGLNGKAYAEDREDIQKILSSEELYTSSINCYFAMRDDVSAAVTDGKIRGGLLSSASNSQVEIKNDSHRRTLEVYYQHLKELYANTLKLYKSRGSIEEDFPKVFLSVISPTVSYQDHLLKKETLTESFNQINTPICNESNPAELNDPVFDLLCFGNSAGVPDEEYLNKLAHFELIGPGLDYITNKIFQIAPVLDYCSSLKDEECLAATDLEEPITSEKLERIKAVLESDAATVLLSDLPKLHTLALYQQGILYGDETVNLILDVLYDPKSGRLRATKSANSNVKSDIELAHKILRSNPILAGNVVSAVFNKNLVKQGSFNSTWYHYAYVTASKPVDKNLSVKTCQSLERNRLLNNIITDAWNVQYLLPSDASDEMKSAYPGCATAVSGASGYSYGLVAQVEGYSVTIPKPESIWKGDYVISPTMIEALRRRDKLHQFLINRSFYSEGDSELKESLLEISTKLLVGKN